MKPSASKAVSIIQVQVDLGTSLEGSALGPIAMEYARLTQELEALGYTVKKEPVEIKASRSSSPARMPVAEEKERLDQLAESCSRLSQLVEYSIRKSVVPIVIGGDHSLSIGSCAGVCNYFQDRMDSVGLLWLDAHGDYHTYATSRTKNVHGMGLSIVLGRADVGEELATLYPSEHVFSPKNAAHVGARALDPPEVTAMFTGHPLGHVLTIDSVEEKGIAGIVAELAGALFNRIRHLHVSLDLDVVDIAFAPGVGTGVRAGLTHRELLFLMKLLHEQIAAQKLTLSLDVVELDPIRDTGNTTAQLAVELVSVLFGRPTFQVPDNCWKEHGR